MKFEMNKLKDSDDFEIIIWMCKGKYKGIIKREVN